MLLFRNGLKIDEKILNTWIYFISSPEYISIDLVVTDTSLLSPPEYIGIDLVVTDTSLISPHQHIGIDLVVTDK